MMMTRERMRRLLDELCIELGFCIPPKVKAELMENPPVDETACVNAVIRAEGLEPEQVALTMFRDMKARARRYYKEEEY